MERSTNQSRWFGARFALALFVLCFATACTDTRESDAGEKIGAIQSAIAQDLSTPIGKKWSELQATGIILGDPTAVEQPLPAGVDGTYQPYANHVIVHSNDFGAVYMPMAFFSKWINLPVYAQFGVPATDYAYQGVVDFDFVEFTGGWMIGDGVGGARVVYGEIYRKFRTYLRELGTPLTEEADTPGVPGGRFQVFLGGELHWGKLEEGNPLTTEDDRWGAAAVFEPILSHWRASGGPSGSLGLPLVDSAALTAPDGDDPDLVDDWIGHSGCFQNGSVYHNRATGVTRVLPGRALPIEYERHGGPKGWLGWPINGAGTTASGKRFVDFATGVLVERNSKVAHAFGNLRFYLGSVGGPPDCLLAEDRDPDLFFYVDVNSTQGKLYNNQRWPGLSGEGCECFDTSPYPVNGELGTSVVANSALAITASVHVFDEDGGTCRANDDLGVIRFTFDIDNLWGAELASNRHEFGSAWATFNIKSTNPFDEKDFRGQKYWSFGNFSTPSLSYTLYDEAFANVDEDKLTDRLDPLKLFYFNTFFESNAAGGNCNGMNVESIHAQLGRSIVGMPIFTNGYLNQQLYDDINVKHGSQLGADVIQWRANEFLRGIAFGTLGDVFAHVRNFEELGDYTIINMMTDKLGGEAHSVRPYRIDDVANNAPCKNFPGQTGCLKIFVADPNVPVSPNNPPASDENRTRPDDTFIEFTRDASEFYYRATSTSTKYSSTSGGVIWFDASHLYASPQVTPFGWQWLEFYKAYMFAVGSSGKTDQITDAQGRTMFEPVQGYPTRWADIRRDAATRIPNVAPVLETNAAADRPQGWIGFGAGTTHAYDIIPTAGVAAQTPVEVAFQSAGLSSLFSLPAIPGKADRVTAHDINGAAKEISLALPSDGSAKAVTWTIFGGVKQRWMELSALGMSPSQSIRIRAENGGKRLRVSNAGPDTSAILRYNDPDRAGGPVNLGTVTIAGNGAVTTIEPGSSTCLSNSACAADQRCLAGACVPLAFNPAQLQPLAWYEASPATVTLAGTAVSEWRDRSGNGHHLTQTSSGNRPSYSATSWNGASPSVTFDGSNDFLEYPASGGSLLNELAGSDQPFTVLLSWEPLDLDADYDLMQWDNGGVSGGNSLIELRTNAAGGDESRYRHRRGDGINSLLNTSTPKFFLNRRTTGFVFTGTALSIYDGDAVHLNGSSNDQASLTLVRYRLGHGDNMPLNGRISEVVITSWALSQAEYQLYRTYARGKWGGL
jgi:hypothetical protein